MTISYDIAGQTALITGASSGFGAHFAKVLAGEGCTVVLGARRKERLEDLAGEIEAEGGKALAVSLDVLDEASIEAAFKAAEESFSVPDIVVNNAGVGWAKDFLDMTEDDWQTIMGTNFTGVRRVAHQAATRLKAAGKPGSIINISSILGLGAQPGQAAYTASKGAVLQLTRTMALELFRYGIRVNALCPGYFATELNDYFFESDAGKTYVKRTPARRLGALDELSLPLLMLASPRSSFVTGIALPVDGGHSARIV